MHHINRFSTFKMISKNKIKYIRSLEQKKNRDALGVFVAEGPKVVGDIMARYPSKLKKLIATEEWLSAHAKDIAPDCEVTAADSSELTKASFLCHPQQVMGVFEKLDSGTTATASRDTLTLVLDGVQDPGNLGTIVRIADWFGIENIVCSRDTADVYNPKVVQATMGSIARVSVTYTPLNDFFNSIPSDVPVYGTLLEGGNMYRTELTRGGIIVMGNEGKGISPEIRRRVTRALRIPNYPEQRETADSLNVAIATAVVCAEFRRSQL